MSSDILRHKNQFFVTEGKKISKISLGTQSRYLAPGAGTPSYATVGRGVLESTLLKKMTSTMISMRVANLIQSINDLIPSNTVLSPSSSMSSPSSAHPSLVIPSILFSNHWSMFRHLNKVSQTVTSSSNPKVTPIPPGKRFFLVKQNI